MTTERLPIPECDFIWCAGRYGDGDHDHDPHEGHLAARWADPACAVCTPVDHPADARANFAGFVETWEEDAEGWVVTPLDYMRETA